MRKLWIALGALVVIIVALDRIGVLVANVALEGALRDRLALSHKPKVRVHGIPFLTQVVGGRYGDIEVDADDLDAGRLHGITAKVRLKGVHVGLSDLGRWDFSTIPIDHANATVSVPYDALAAASGIAGVTLTEHDGALQISGPLRYAGRTVDVRATAAPQIVNGELRLHPTRATAAGTTLPASALAAFDRGISLRDLPFGLRVTDVAVNPDGLAGRATVDDVTIRDGQLVPRSSSTAAPVGG